MKIQHINSITINYKYFDVKVNDSEIIIIRVKSYLGIILKPTHRQINYLVRKMRRWGFDCSFYPFLIRNRLVFYYEGKIEERPYLRYER